MKRTRTLVLAILATLVLSGVAIGGVVFAQTPSATPSTTTPAPTPGQGSSQAAAHQTAVNNFINQLAQNLGISTATLENALKKTADAQVAQAVASGKLTQAQGAQIEQRINNGQFPLRIAGLGARQRTGARGSVQIGADAAAALGISTSELQQDLKNGQSLAQIAQAHGKTLQQVADAVKASLDPQVQAGTLTQQQENKILQAIESGSLGVHRPKGGSQSSAAPASQ